MANISVGIRLDLNNGKNFKKNPNMNALLLLNLINNRSKI